MTEVGLIVALLLLVAGVWALVGIGVAIIFELRVLLRAVIELNPYEDDDDPDDDGDGEPLPDREPAQVLEYPRKEAL